VRLVVVTAVTVDVLSPQFLFVGVVFVDGAPFKCASSSRQLYGRRASAVVVFVVVVVIVFSFHAHVGGSDCEF